MRKRLPVVLAYLMLFLLSLPIPLLHHYHTGQAIERARLQMKMDDGTFIPTMLPADVLFLRWFGELSQTLAIVLFILLVASFWWDELLQKKAMTIVAICQCAFTTLYAVYATFLLATGGLNRGLN